MNTVIWNFKNPVLLIESTFIPDVIRSCSEFFQFKIKIYKCFILCCISVGNASTATGGGGILGPVPITRFFLPSVVIPVLLSLRNNESMMLEIAHSALPYSKTMDADTYSENCNIQNLRRTFGLSNSGCSFKFLTSDNIFCLSSGKLPPIE